MQHLSSAIMPLSLDFPMAEGDGHVKPTFPSCEKRDRFPARCSLYFKYKCDELFDLENSEAFKAFGAHPYTC